MLIDGVIVFAGKFTSSSNRDRLSVHLMAALEGRGSVRPDSGFNLSQPGGSKDRGQGWCSATH